MKARHNTVWTEDDIAQLKAMIEADLTLPEIARKIGRSQEGTRAQAARHGWVAKPAARRRWRPLI